MHRVSDVRWSALHVPEMAVDAPGEVIIIRAGGSYDGKQGMSLATGVSSRSAGSQALCLHLVAIPPGTRGVPHVHDGHESAIFTVSGETEVWHGEGLLQRSVVRARTDPQEQESVVTVSLPPHLYELNDFPIASQ